MSPELINLIVGDFNRCFCELQLFIFRKLKFRSHIKLD